MTARAMTARAMTARTWASSSVLLLGGCSLAIDANREQCASDGDCARLGPESADSVCTDSLCSPRPDPAWACLDETTIVESLNAPQQIQFTARLINIFFNRPEPDVELLVCERLDAECQIPVASGVSDPAGEVTLTLAGGFNGYLRWESPGAQPVLYFFRAPLVRDSVLQLQVIAPQIMAGLDAQFAGLTVENRAVVVAFASNCNGVPAAGVRVTALEGDGSTRTYYETERLFPPSQMATSDSGVVRIINVPTGYVSITGTLSNGREIATNRVLTRTGFVTITVLSPQPP